MTYLKKNAVPAKYQQADGNIGERVVRNKRELVSYNQTSHIRIWYNNQPEGYALHAHEALEVFICIQNDYQINANNKTYILKEGDILIIPPLMSHEYINDKTGIRFIYLIELSNFFKSHDYKSIEPLFFDAFLCNMKTCPDIYETVYRLFMEMNAVYFTNANFWETIVYDKIYQVFIEISKHSEFLMSEEFESSSHSTSRINALLKYIDVNYSEEISTERAAEYTGFSKYHFLRLFKLQTGYTFHEYLTIKRISKAESLLATDIPITEIAFQTGFNTLPSFCRTFKKYKNYSPSDYKKLILNANTDNHSNL